jgi:hypothetical protein
MKRIGLLKVCFLLGFIGWNLYLKRINLFPFRIIFPSYQPRLFDKRCTHRNFGCFRSSKTINLYLSSGWKTGISVANRLTSGESAKTCPRPMKRWFVYGVHKRRIHKKQNRKVFLLIRIRTVTAIKHF